MKNLGTLTNMINEAVENLRTRNRLLYEDVADIVGMQMECMKLLGDILGKIEKYTQ